MSRTYRTCVTRQTPAPLKTLRLLPLRGSAAAGR
jgi:hypothetical protein